MAEGMCWYPVHNNIADAVALVWVFFGVTTHLKREDEPKEEVSPLGTGLYQYPAQMPFEVGQLKLHSSR